MVTTSAHIDVGRHPIHDADYVRSCRARLDHDGALVLRGFFSRASVDRAVAESENRVDEAYFASSTHNVYLMPCDPSLADDHPFNRQVPSSKGLLADDQVPEDSPLREVYDDLGFRSFVSGVVGVDAVHPYADDLSSINVHFAGAGQELGWHFDNSSFAVTMLLRAPDAGGDFEFVRDARDSASGDMGFDRVGDVLDGAVPAERLDIAAGDLVLFRGRDALHRVTPTVGDTTRMLVVFAFNAEPGVTLSESALETFYGRMA